MMFIWVLFSILAATSAGFLDPGNRFLGVTRTSTIVALSSTTIPTTVKRTCWTSAGAAVTQCRRRRGIEEQPEISGLDHPLNETIQPTQTMPLEATKEVQSEDILEKNVSEETKTAGTDLESSTEENKDTENFTGRSAFGLTFYYKSTTTVVLTYWSMVTSGATTYTIATCYPNVIANDKC